MSVFKSVFKSFRIIKDLYLIIIIEYCFSNKTPIIDIKDKRAQISSFVSWHFLIGFVCVQST